MKEVFFILIILFLSEPGLSQNDTVYKKFYFDNGSISSEGKMVNGNPVGYWKAYYETGLLKSEGNRENLKLSGTWKFYRDNGDIMKEISYSDGMKDGPTRLYNDSCKLVKEEMYRRDVLDGKTKTYYTPGSELKSVIPFKDGVRDGVAYEFAKDGRIITMTTYDHDFIKKKEKINRMNSLGKQKIWREFYPADSSLKREMRFKDNIYHGYYKEYDRDGKLIVALLYINGIIQENPEELTALDIKRTYYENGALKWEGTYNYLGEEEGTFKSFSKKGEIEEAKIYSKGELLAKGKLNRKGERIEYWEFYYPDNRIRAKGDYKEGLKIGQWKYFHQNGKLEQKGKYVKGEKAHGDWVWYYSNGEIWREEAFWKGKEDGLAIEYSDTGTVVSKGEYIDGKRDGIWFYELGDHREEGSYIEGKRDGEWIYYYPNKKINFRGSYINGDPNGKHVYYYPNGKMKREEYYELGYQEGTWRSYDELGNITLTSQWQAGREIKLEKMKVK